MSPARTMKPEAADRRTSSMRPERVVTNRLVPRHDLVPIDSQRRPAERPRVYPTLIDGDTVRAMSEHPPASTPMKAEAQRSKTIIVPAVQRSNPIAANTTIMTSNAGSTAVRSTTEIPRTGAEGVPQSRHEASVPWRDSLNAALISPTWE